jgi:voltage-gated potassium channel
MFPLAIKSTLRRTTYFAIATFEQRNNPMAQETASARQPGHAYNIFIFVLTIVSLVIMVAMFLPLGAPTIGLLQVYDNVICFIFLFDFFLTLSRAPKKSDYFLKHGGWLDLLGSIPSLGVTFQYTGLFRLARLSRLARITRLMRGAPKGELVRDIEENRSRYTVVVTILLTFIVLATASVLVLEFESHSSEAKITTGRDALWYSVVTITTVGYGDYFPITAGGRITAVFLMVAGLGLIGVLASLMATLLIGSPSSNEDETPDTAPTLDQELALIKTELATLRQLMEKMAKESKT